jgi:hypothetical protein
VSDDEPTFERDAPAPSDLPPQLVELEQRRHLRRILRGFVAVVVLLPLAGLGGTWAYLLLPTIAAAVFATREAVLLRQSVRRYGVVREP